MINLIRSNFVKFLKCFFFIVVLYIYLLGSVWAQTQSDVTDYFLVEEDQALRIEDVQALTFQAHINKIDAGLGNQTVWLRMYLPPIYTSNTNQESNDNYTLRSGTHIATRADRKSRLVAENTVEAWHNKQRFLRVGPHTIDNISLYQQVNGQWQESVAGDQQDSNANHCPDDLYCFELTDGQSSNPYLYLRISNNGSLRINTEIVNTAELIQSTSVRIRKITRSLTLAVSLWLASLLILFIQRKKLSVMYVFFQTTVVLYLLTVTGELERIFPAGFLMWRSDFSDILIIVRIFIMVIIFRMIGFPFHAPEYYLKIFKILLALCLVSAIFIIFGNNQLGIRIILIVFWIAVAVNLYALQSSTHITGTYKVFLTASLIFTLVFLTFGAIIASGFLQQIDFISEGFISQFSDLRMNGTALGIGFIACLLFDYRNKMLDEENKRLYMHTLSQTAQFDKDKLEERSTLIDMLAHELKNPLATIKLASSSLLQVLNMNDVAMRRIKSISASADRMNNLIDHVGDVNKLETSTYIAQSTSIDFVEFIGDITSGRSAAHTINVKAALKSVLYTDRALLTLIADNLVHNAINYSPPDSPITICLESKSNGVTELVVINTVIAGNEPDETRLFKRYYRHATSLHKPGMGLGLSLVQSAAKKINAQIFFTMEADKVLFTLRLQDEPH